MANLNHQSAAQTITLEPNDARRLANLCGQFDEHLRLIEQRLDIEIRNRGNLFAFYGDNKTSKVACELIYNLYRETESNPSLAPDEVHLFLQQSSIETRMDKTTAKSAGIPPQEATPNNSGNVENITVIRTKKGNIKPRGVSQQRYVRSIQTHDINFGVGPAGTGKTYLAVACAVEALLRDEVERILLVRPAVEAGEKLGFLPGDLSQKVDPYLRPLYDALYEMLGAETVCKLIDRGVIEIAPLAYMRGRTLNGSFIILDESQNTTCEQMKMFLTRIGFGSTAVITGDTSQIDLPRGTRSGLLQVCEVLKDVEDISFSFFTSKDVVRHPLVQQIVDAYDNFQEDSN
ncbi:MAG: PhoH family protein [Pseudomonadales bacterium]|nr:PhoH family protein [Pseudomonadales bacterium]MCP5302186.1 PhoH family protein [Pseudomonadales bacterium]